MELRKAVDNLCIYDPGFSGYAEAFVSDLGGSSDKCQVSCIADLQSAISSFTNVKYLEIILHGLPGMIQFADNVVMVGPHLGTMTQGTNLIAKNARILFASCDIGKGEAGDLFMAELAKRMLVGKGGIIGAATVANTVYLPRSRFAMGPFMELSDGSTLKVRRYDLSGKQIGARDVDRFGRVR